MPIMLDGTFFPLYAHILRVETLMAVTGSDSVWIVAEAMAPFLRICQLLRCICLVTVMR